LHVLVKSKVKKKIQRTNICFQSIFWL